MTKQARLQSDVIEQDSGFMDGWSGNIVHF